jgi:hypothetical protein
MIVERYNTPFARFVKKNFGTINKFKKVLSVSEPTVRLYLKHPTRMRIEDFNRICNFLEMKREDVWKSMTIEVTIKNEGNE